MDGDHAAMIEPRGVSPRLRVAAGRAIGTAAHAGGPRAWPWALPVVVLLVPLLLWPLGTILWRGLAPEGVPDAEAIVDVLGDGYYWERLVFTTAQAAASTALALAVGLPAAYVFAHIRFPGRAVARALVTVPFVLPTLVVALAFQQLAGPHGLLNHALARLGLGPVEVVGTIWAILAAHVFYNVSIVIRLVAGVWANLDPHTEEAARLLGAGRWATLREVTLPALAPAIASAVALVFVFTFTSFGVVLVLGGPGLDTLEVVIYRLAIRLVELPAAAVLSSVQIAATVAVLGGYSLLQRRTARPLTRRSERARPLREGSVRFQGSIRRRTERSPPRLSVTTRPTSPRSASASARRTADAAPRARRAGHAGSVSGSTREAHRTPYRTGRPRRSCRSPASGNSAASRLGGLAP